MWLGILLMVAMCRGAWGHPFPTDREAFAAMLDEQLRMSHNIAEFPRDVVKTLYVKNGGTRGTWQAPDFCPVGTYAAGFRIKLERAMYATGDDTSMNGVRMTCMKPGRLDFFGTISSESAYWGRWSRAYECPKTSRQEAFLTKFSLKVEPRRGNFRDDSAVNNIKFICRLLIGGNEDVLESMGGPWGTFSGWSGQCGTGSAICGVQTKIAAPRGPGDDTGLNDIRFFCCNDQYIHRCEPRRRKGVPGYRIDT